jgi:hypothetical protein
MGKGIDYGLGTTNIDHKTGIRFGVIPVNDVCQAWCDSAEPDYGPPTCGHCGNDAVEVNGPAPNGYKGYSSGESVAGRHVEYKCISCRVAGGSEHFFGDEPVCHILDDGEYKAHDDSHGDIFILKSPYYTRAAFCSPCAPGACHLRTPDPDGERAYCFGHDFFDDGTAPYPVFSVATDEPVDAK